MTSRYAVYVPNLDVMIVQTYETYDDAADIANDCDGLVIDLGNVGHDKPIEEEDDDDEQFA